MNMIKAQIDDNELVTKGFLRETINEAINGLARTINKSFIEMESRMDRRFIAQQKDLLALSERVDRVDSRLEKFEQTTEEHFNKVFLEIKDIRREINDNNTDMAQLEFRVKKLEKKAGLQ